MRAIEFPEQTFIIAEDQPEYAPLPAHDFKDAAGTVAFCWRLTWKERLTLLFTGKVWHRVMTFGASLQPQMLTVEKPVFQKDNPDMVTVTAADFNGRDFDGCPFSATPMWLRAALDAETVRLVWANVDYDCAVWSVATAEGYVLARPGDVIVYGGVDAPLRVVKKEQSDEV